MVVHHPHKVTVSGSSPLITTNHSECSAVWLAHLVWDQGVLGSNPSTPTNLCLGSLIVEHRSYKAKTAEHYRNEVPNYALETFNG